jgi:hypothetical protein
MDLWDLRTELRLQDTVGVWRTEFAVKLQERMGVWRKTVCILNGIYPTNKKLRGP